MKITEFFNTDYLSYANYDSYRSVASFIDGLKPSARKILYTVDKLNIRSKTKVSQLASKCSEETEYLHGAGSLEGVTVGLAQDFAGANNMNFLRPEGSFGNRSIQKAAASRYIFTSKNDSFDEIFVSSDKKILIGQEFEGTTIEPKFFCPILPVLLINGSEGIGNGFAQKILSRNPQELSKLIQARIAGKSFPKSITPWFKNFKGKVTPSETGWEITGNFVRTSQVIITVNELPITYDLEKYLSILTRLEEDRVILDFKDFSEGNTFKFEIKVTREFMKHDDDWILNKLKLIKRISENFTCIGENNEIVEFNDVGEILEAYFTVRMKYYQKRKDYLVAKLKSELGYLGSKYFFVKLVLEDKIKVFKQTKAAVEKQLVDHSSKYPLITQDDSWDYLLNMPIMSLTAETFAALKNQIDIKKKLLDETETKEISNMWKEDLSKINTKKEN